MKLQQTKYEKKDAKDLGERIKAARKKTNLTQTDVARQLGKSLRTVQKYESGEIEPPYNVLQQIIELFHCPQEEILLSPAEQPIYHNALDFFRRTGISNSFVPDFLYKKDSVELLIENDDSFIFMILDYLRNKETDPRGPYHLAFEKYLEEEKEQENQLDAENPSGIR